jgi:hypothetical protein
MVSMFFVVPASMALPLRPSVGATPQPSCTLPHDKKHISTGGLFDWARSLHETDFVLHLNHRKERAREMSRGWVTRSDGSFSSITIYIQQPNSTTMITNTSGPTLKATKMVTYPNPIKYLLRMSCTTQKGDYRRRQQATTRRHPLES